MFQTSLYRDNQKGDFIEVQYQYNSSHYNNIYFNSEKVPLVIIMNISHTAVVITQSPDKNGDIRQFCKTLVYIHCRRFSKSFFLTYLHMTTMVWLRLGKNQGYGK